jgi:hypothetical protein
MLRPSQAIALVFVTIIVVFVACSGKAPAAAPSSGAAPVGTGSVAGTSQAAAPIRIIHLQDKTGSSDTTRTPLLTLDQLRRSTALCRVRGGEVLVGLIRDESNRLFVRYTVLPPPEEPVFQPQSSNAISAQAEKHRFDKRLADYRDRRNAWEAKAAHDEEVFLREAAELLKGPPDAERSDVHGALTRADLAAAEDDAVFGAPTHRYIVLVSDAIDNVQKPAPEMKSGATIIVVNGAASLGTIASLNPKRFESIDAALNFIAAQEGSAPSAARKD